MQVIIKLDDGIARYGHRLAEMADKVDRAEREGLQEGGKLVLTKIRRTLRSQMGTKAQGPITSHTSGSLAGDKAFVIRGVGKGLPITDFPVKGGRKRAGNWRDQPRDGEGRFGALPDNAAGKVVATPWGVSHRFARSYATLGGQFVSRRPGSRQVQKLYGPSVAKEIGKDESAAVFEAEAAATVQRCIVKRLGRLF